jgi:hypothetical protein
VVLDVLTDKLKNILNKIREPGIDKSRIKQRKIMLEMVNKYGFALQYADDTLKQDGDFVLEAVKKHGWTLQCADGC